MEQQALLPIGRIQVVDSRTRRTVKVACMSCIRGHRTTSCGKASCRSKVFWTVKRPGRPNNACTCPRLGSKGECQCNIATSGCPHRSKKGGESRSIDCRCDEEGRRCCVLESHHWDALCLRQTPIIVFYESPEQLNLARVPPTSTSSSSTPSFPAGTPQSTSSLPTTPGPMSGLQPSNTGASPLSSYQSAPYEPPRFGFMGVGSPMGGEGHVGSDVLQWQGQVPQAPLQSNAAFAHPQSGMLPNQAFPVTLLPPTLPQQSASQQQYQHFDLTPVAQTLQDMTAPPQSAQLQTPVELQRNQWMEDYYNYQFPSAICQNCGLHGCNCRSCPAVMQNAMDGSWATCCSRKHVRNAEVAALGINHSSVALEHQDIQQLQPQIGSGLSNQVKDHGITGLKPGGDQPFSPSFTMDEASLQSAADQDFMEWVMPDLDLPSHGCCCGGDT